MALPLLPNPPPMGQPLLQLLNNNADAIISHFWPHLNRTALTPQYPYQLVHDTASYAAIPSNRKLCHHSCYELDTIMQLEKLAFISSSILKEFLIDLEIYG